MPWSVLFIGMSQFHWFIQEGWKSEKLVQTGPILYDCLSCGPCLGSLAGVIPWGRDGNHGMRRTLPAYAISYLQLWARVGFQWKILQRPREVVVHWLPKVLYSSFLFSSSNHSSSWLKKPVWGLMPGYYFIKHSSIFRKTSELQPQILWFLLFWAYFP